MLKQTVTSVLLLVVAISLIKAVDENSAGWGSVAVCLMIYFAAWGTGDQVARGLDRLDEIERALRARGDAGQRP